MAEFINNSLTARGKALLAGAQTGAIFVPVSIVLGSGNMPSGTTAESMTAVVTPFITLDINKVERTGDGNVIYGGAFTNADLTQDTYFRELGMYARLYYPATDTYSDTVLYSYGNAGNTADLIPAYGPGQLVERQMNLVVYVGNETEVSLEVPSGLFIPQSEKGAAGGVATLDDTGTIPAGQLPAMDYVKRTGDTMTGDLLIDGGADWHRFAVQRTLEAGVYTASFGAGTNGGASIQVFKDGEQVTRAEVVPAGIQFDLKQRFAAQADMTPFLSGTILEYALNVLTNTTKLIFVTSYRPSDIPVPADGFLEILMRGTHKMVRFTPFNAPYGPWTRFIYNGAWVGAWARSGGLLTDVILYVAVDGSDTTGTGAETAPFATLAKALSVLPKDLGGHLATIWVSAGTYSEARVTVENFSNGDLHIRGVSDTNKSTFTNGIYVNECDAIVTLSYLRMRGGSANPAFEARVTPVVFCTNCEGVGASNVGDAFRANTLAGVCLTACVSDAAAAAVSCRGGRVVVYSISGNAAVGFSASGGGQIAISTDTGAWTARYHTENGARIYAGAQTAEGRY